MTPLDETSWAEPLTEYLRGINEVTNTPTKTRSLFKTANYFVNG